MLLMVEKETRGGIGQAIHRYAKAISQKLPVNGFQWIGQISEFDERFIKNYDEDSNKGYFLEVDVEYPKSS